MTGVKIKPVKAVQPPPPNENQEQRAIVKWLKLHPILKDFVIKLNNEGQRSPGQTWNLKMMGLCNGASDLFIAYPVKRTNGHWYHGLWIEMKRKKKYTPSERSTDTWIAQESFQELMKSVGFQAKFCYGWEEAMQVIERYLQGSDEL
jgi:hypothetical protein